MRVVTLVRRILHVRRVDRDATRLLFRRVVDLVVRLRRRQTLLRQNQRDRRRQRRLPVIHVPNRPNVHVRLRPIKLLFGHVSPSLTCFADLGDDLFADRFRHFVVSGELHGVVAAALRHGAQVGRVAEHLREGHPRRDHLDAGPRLHVLDVAAARREVADDVAHVVLGDDDLDVHDRFLEDRLGLLGRRPGRPCEPAILKAISDESTSWYEPS